MSERRVSGLVLPGGGARAAYQVGVLKAIAEMLPPRAGNPFPVLTGISAGAINATVLATRARRFRQAVADLERVWRGFHVEQVFRADALSMLGSSLRWLVALVSGGVLMRPPKALLNDEPLRQLLLRYVDFSRIQRSIDRGALAALAVTASGYATARSISFFQAEPGQRGWERARREGRPARIHVEHLMASVAVPFIFAPEVIDGEYYGDGAMRQSTPLSAAVHLGADRLLVIGVRDELHNPPPSPDDEPALPSFGQIAGYMLDTLFMDGLYGDLERLTRVNELLEGHPGTGAARHFRRIEALVIVPSRDIRSVASDYVDELPQAVRLLLKGIGAFNRGERQLISYLLFESGYTGALIELGYRDAMERERSLRAFIAGDPLPVLDAPARIRHDLEDGGPFEGEPRTTPGEHTAAS